MPHQSIAILDFGSQYAQLIARRVREAHVYCELFPWDAPAEKVMALQPKGFILSGGPASVYAEGAPTLPGYVIDSGLPVFGICYGMQLLVHTLGGKVDPSARREYGPAEIQPLVPGTILDAVSTVWMSHGDRIMEMPPGFVALAKSGNSPIAAMGDFSRKYFAVQFHPEVNNTPHGAQVLEHFAVEVCGCAPDWTPQSIIEESVARIRAQVGAGRVLAAVSGGVDSSVAAALVHKAIGDQQVAVFVDTGLLRQGEPEQVVRTFREQMGAELVAVDASAEFFTALRGVTRPGAEAQDRRGKIHPHFRTRSRQAGGGEVPRPGHHLPGRGRVRGTRPGQGCPDQEPPQRGRAAGAHGHGARGAAALPVQGRGAGGGGSPGTAGKPGVEAALPGSRVERALPGRGDPRSG